MNAALITGASSGIGEEFARQLAARGANLVLVARTEVKLAQLCAELGARHGIEAQYVALDLAEAEAAARLFAETERRGVRVETLINNAAFGAMGDFIELELERQLRMIDLNIRSLVALTHLYLKPMRARGRGEIINVASTAAYQPVPYMSVYAATKAFVLSFSEALWAENRPYGVHVMALCPGPTETNFFAAAGVESRAPFRAMQKPSDVVRTALAALERRQSSVVSGWGNYLLVQSERLFPRAAIARAIARALKNHYAKRDQPTFEEKTR